MIRVRAHTLISFSVTVQSSAVQKHIAFGLFASFCLVYTYTHVRTDDQKRDDSESVSMTYSLKHSTESSFDRNFRRVSFHWNFVCANKMHVNAAITINLGRISPRSFCASLDPDAISNLRIFFSVCAEINLQIQITNFNG